MLSRSAGWKTDVAAAIETTYKPELIVEEKTFYLYSGQNRWKDYLVEYSYESRPIGYVSNAEFMSDFQLRLLNIGLGPTKKIHITFAFDLAAAARQITGALAPLPKEKQVHIQIEKHTFSFDYNEIGPPQCAHAAWGQMNMQINHMLTVSQSHEPYLLRVPSVIAELFAAHLNSTMEGEPRNHNSFPPLIVDFSYTDIGNKPFHKKMEILFDQQVVSRIFASVKLRVKELEPEVNGNR